MESPLSDSTTTGSPSKSGSGKQFSRPLEVHDSEPKLARVLVNAGAAPDDLLKLNQRLNALVEHNEFASPCIHSGRQQLRGRSDDRISPLGVDKIVECESPVLAVARDADCELRRRSPLPAASTWPPR